MSRESMDYDMLLKLYQSKKLSEMAEIIKSTKEELAAAAAAKAKIQKLYDFITISVVPEMMEDQGVSTMKVEGVGRLQCAANINCSCPAKNREALQQWFLDRGHSSLITNTINSSTLKAFVVEQIKAEGEWPKDLLKVEPYSRATVVKA